MPVFCPKSVVDKSSPCDRRRRSRATEAPAGPLLTVPLLVRCVGQSSGDELIRPELPA